MISFSEDIKEALSVLRAGGTILYPTDTIWGIGCDATNSDAVAQIYKIKQREDTKSMLVLVDADYMVERYVKEVPEIAWELIQVSDEPLTIIYPGAQIVSPKLIAADGSLAIRVSSERFSKELISRFRKPIVSTSANISGDLSPSNFSEIQSDIIKQVDYVVRYRQDDRTKAKPSGIIKLGIKGEVQVIRK
ncbi:MAG: threonylcarbamoyl-AMP synthase [Bacteroidales bacterium]|nr:threonylcarbamoyl-AMP synthase [Bacteroidales bacterium]MCF8456578.1 threonylcarbamoyl-AMP synthase [Bacteroidales bacterium]